jgi:SET domain-containing protein
MEPKVTVKSFLKDSTEKGLFAKGAIVKGEHIFTLEGFVIENPTRLSIQISETAHIDWGENAFFGYFNHSCDPNCAIDIETLHVYALKDIHDDEELYFNYNSTEFDMANPFDCLCNSSHCVSRVKGYKYLTPEQRENMKHYVAKHLLTLFEKQ